MGRHKKKNKNKNKGNQNNGENKESKANRRRKNREKLKQVAAQNFDKFVKQLEDLGLRIKEMRGDGNCLFRAVGDQIEGNEENHNFYRQSSVEYMIENQDHFKFFIEDDQSFDNYIDDMKKDGAWGGNLEIYALSMRFNVNFYIHIYNHPMFIVKNFSEPLRNIHLSYHDGSHYNSVRLKDDFGDDIPKCIPLELINCVEQTSNLQNFDDLDDENFLKDIADQDLENDYYLNSISSTNKAQEQENKATETETNENDIEEIVCNGTNIKDIRDKSKNEKFKNCIMTKNGDILDESIVWSNCHCNTKKKYKNCCATDDIKGEYDKSQNIFYCDIENFKTNFHYEIKDNFKNNNDNNTIEVSVISKQLDKIFI